MLKRILMMCAGLLVALTLLLSINVLAGTGLRSARFDLTANKLYTLSDGAKAVLAKIEEPITLRFYYSKQLAQKYPPLPSYGRRVEELLLEFENRSGGKLELEVIDPEPFTEAEDRAVQLGLQGVPVPSGETLYFGLAGTNTIGDEEVIPFFSIEKEAFLEYDLTKLVHGLSTTGMTDEVSWGLYIANFTFLVGMATAAVMLVIPVYVYRNRELHDLVIFGELLAVAASRHASSRGRLVAGAPGGEGPRAPRAATPADRASSAARTAGSARGRRASGPRPRSRA